MFGDSGGVITFDSELEAAPDPWSYTTFDASPQHVAAVCVKTDGEPLSLRVVRSIPLQSCSTNLASSAD